MLGRYTIAIVLGVVMLGGTLGAAFLEKDDPNQHDWWAFCTLIATLAGAGQGLFAARNVYDTANAKLRDDAQLALLKLLLRTVALTQVSINSLGAHVYRLNGIGVPWSTFTLLRNKHVSVFRARYGETEQPQPCTIVWMRGKGVIGSCWEQCNIPIWWPCPPELRKCANEVDYGKLSGDVTLGLTWKESRQANKYGGVIAYPIVAQNTNGTYEYLGCVTLDVLERAEYDRLFARRTEINTLLEHAATHVAESLRANNILR